MKFLRAMTSTIVGIILPNGVSARTRRVTSWIVRNGLLVAMIYVTATSLADPESTKALLNVIEAGLVAIAMSSVAAFIYSSVNWHDERPTSSPIRVGNRGVDEDPWLTEIVIAARLKVLGMIFLGMCILTGTIYWGTYYIKTLPIE